MGCSVEGCEAKHYCKGYCRPHYTRWTRNGDPLVTRKPGRPRRYCTIDGCDDPQVGQGLCDRHYRRLQRHGDPLITKRIIGDDEARWWSHVDRRGDDECWPWTSSTDGDGYGQFGVGQNLVKAHIWGYERFRAPVPPGMQLDHVKANGCTMRHCVNYLRHLEPVTNRENCLRGNRTKLSDADVLILYGRWIGGDGSVDGLAEESGVDRTTLYRRFRRIRGLTT